MGRVEEVQKRLVGLEHEALLLRLRQEHHISETELERAEANRDFSSLEAAHARLRGREATTRQRRYRVGGTGSRLGAVRAAAAVRGERDASKREKRRPGGEVLESNERAELLGHPPDTQGYPSLLYPLQDFAAVARLEAGRWYSDSSSGGADGRRDAWADIVTGPNLGRLGLARFSSSTERAEGTWRRTRLRYGVNHKY